MTIPAAPASSTKRAWTSADRGGNNYFTLTARSRLNGQVSTRPIRIKTIEDRREERLAELEQLVQVYPYYVRVPKVAMSRWKDTIRRSGASAVNVPFGEYRVLLLNKPVANTLLTCGYASDLDLCALCTKGFKNSTNPLVKVEKMTFIGPRLMRRAQSRRSEPEFDVLDRSLDPSSVRQAARDMGISMYRRAGHVLTTEVGLTETVANQLINNARLVQEA